MPEQLMQIRASAPLKAVMTLTVMLALFASWFVVRWYLGNTIAEYFHPEDHRMETAQMAVSLAPSDPVPHWRLGNLAQKELPPDQISVAVSEYEKAVSLSPSDYRLWMEFGGALEQAGDFDKAEKALREAVKLAPSYAYPRWYMGNLLLRTDRYDEGFAELQRASEANGQFQPQLFNLAWQLNKSDFESLKAAVGNSPAMRASFSKYLLEREHYDEGLRLWSGLTETEKRENRIAADAMIGSLIAAHRYHQAMEIWNEVAPGPTYRADFGHILDRGFEDNLAHGPGAVFGWQVQSNSQVQIGIDAGMGHTGSRSLRVYFQVRSHIESINVSQLVPVKPDTEYDFECYLKTDKLESAETPVITMVNAADEAYLGGSAPAPSGNSGWQRISFSFKTGPKTEAVKVRMVRNTCADSAVCPIFGTVWYDDFDLKPRK
ncbi:MAG TPA: tetratricopeptide repeat protein [Pyrinomonadaceae bacterium]|jgi:tetratricopeptide (TPR) repeat protein|nr:tetratricopeptide repeat protein [Pyrinomonadaceae bacterium]